MAPYKNGTWHTPPKINKYDDTQKNGALEKWNTLRKNAQRLFAKGWVESFLKGNS